MVDSLPESPIQISSIKTPTTDYRSYLHKLHWKP